MVRDDCISTIIGGCSRATGFPGNFDLSAVLVQSLDNFRNDILSTFPRINEGRGISLEGRVRVNSTLTDPDSTVDALIGEIRYNQSTDKFQGYVADAGSGSPGWKDFH